MPTRTRSATSVTRCRSSASRSTSTTWSGGSSRPTRRRPTSEEFQRFRLDPLDPAVLALGVIMAVIRVPGRAIPLHLLIGLGHRGPSPEVVAERQVPVNAVVAGRVAMKMEAAQAGDRVAERAEAAALQPIFAVPGIAELLDMRARRLDHGKV